MVRLLTVNNFALIRELSQSFKPGYTVITGETGSGKSILLNALNLLSGERADFSVIGPHGEKSVVEAFFSVENDEFRDILQQNDIDVLEELIVRREIHVNGRSRAFINDTPVQLTVMRQVMSKLIYIHSQYNTIELKDSDFQLELLDILAGVIELKKSFKKRYRSFQDLNSEIKDLKENYRKNLQERDYLDFQLNELSSLQLDQINYNDLEEKFSDLENADKIKSALQSISDIDQGEGGMLSALYASKNLLDKIPNKSNSIQELSDRLNTLIIELKELSSDATDMAIDLDSSDLDKEALQSQLDLFNQALNKHGLKSQNELNSLLLHLKERVEGDQINDERISLMEKELEAERVVLNNLATELHQKRLNAVPEIEKTILQLLSDLKLPETTLKFELQKKESLNESGFTKLQMLFSANKGMSPVPIEKAASGGELSRVMLALQKLISEKKQLPTILFDEIDTGVSGEVAQKIGELLLRMGRRMQLIAISHLPQVAARAEHHLRVEKAENGQGVETSIRDLDKENSIQEIARLMSGEKIDSSAIANAKVLMGL
jgi:DNA repair protein RecN (Recombination protein N)